MDRRFFAWMLLTLSLFMLWQHDAAGSGRTSRSFKAQAKEEEEKKTTRSREGQRGPRRPSREADIIHPPPEEPATWHHSSRSKLDIVVISPAKGRASSELRLVDQMKTGHFRYRSLANRGGYLGYLAGEATKEGLRIRSVAPAHPLRPPSTKPIRLPSV